MKFDDLWPHLESLSEAQADSIYKAAGSDKRYRLEVFGLFAFCLLVIAAFSFAVPAFYRAYHPTLPVKLMVAAGSGAAIWFGVGALRLLNQSLYYRAIMRILGKEGIAGGP